MASALGLQRGFLVDWLHHNFEIYDHLVADDLVSKIFEEATRSVNHPKLGTIELQLSRVGCINALYLETHGIGFVLDSQVAHGFAIFDGRDVERGCGVGRHAAKKVVALHVAEKLFGCAARQVGHRKTAHINDNFRALDDAFRRDHFHLFRKEFTRVEAARYF